ncbi:MAG: tRNA (adenosine(37)-N6)-dimethylallyltransferase MiaA [Gemmatimonadales bacterium]|nr:MAG: tRNA (adenosine(37)-N6)-dimethylallyltransferase MiaA [Gemmatimonadales bacterium]
MSSGAPPVLVITGPTASGKTALSLPVAEALGGEIISMDSRQVYRGMDIGTAKVLPGERDRVPHFGLDLVDPGERYSAGQFARDARTWIREIRGRGRQPLLVGGTGFFLKALVDPVFREPPRDEARRRALESWLARLDAPALARWLEVLDPNRAELALAGGPQRAIRTLEVALRTGRPLSWWHENAPPEAPPVEVRTVLLQRDREALYQAINRRARAMFDDGLPDEVCRLLEAGARSSDPGMTGTGYREAAALLAGEVDREEAIRQVQAATRRYARRQVTWFRHQLRGPVLSVDADRPVQEQVETVLRWWHDQMGGRVSPGTPSPDPTNNPPSSDPETGRAP